jgi:hypothetical protein
MPAPPDAAARAEGPVALLTAPRMDAQVRMEAGPQARLAAWDTADAPAPVPEGLAAYTPYLWLRLDAAGRPRLAVTLRLGEEACSRAVFRKLEVFRWTPRQGWAPVAAQVATWRRRDFAALVEAGGVYAVLGPAGGLETDPMAALAEQEATAGTADAEGVS